MNEYSKMIIIKEAFGKLNLNAIELMVFSVIYGFSEQGKPYYGGLDYIADFLPISESTYKRALNKLLKEKLIYVYDKTRRKYVYGVDFKTLNQCLYDRGQNDTDIYNSLYVGQNDTNQDITNGVKMNANGVKMNANGVKMNANGVKMTPIETKIETNIVDSVVVSESAGTHTHTHTNTNTLKDISKKLNKTLEKYNFSKDLKAIIINFYNHLVEINQSYTFESVRTNLKMINDKLKKHQEAELINLINDMIIENQKAIYYDRLKINPQSMRKNKPKTIVNNQEPDWINEVIEDISEQWAQEEEKLKEKHSKVLNDDD